MMRLTSNIQTLAKFPAQGVDQGMFSLVMKLFQGLSVVLALTKIFGDGIVKGQ